VYADAVDPETRSALQQLAGEELHIPASMHHRISGDDLPSMRRDASELAKALGIGQEPAHQRDEQGRFAKTSSGLSMTRLIRESAGYYE
jgi:hypothetical protein